MGRDRYEDLFLSMENPSCASCDCPPFTHVYFHKCELFDKKDVCIDCSRDTPVEEFLNNVKNRTNKEVTAEDIRNICKNEAHITLK